jgi:hypothetical protein
MNSRLLAILLAVGSLLLIPDLAGADPLSPGEVKEHNEGAVITIEYTTYSAYNPAVAYSPNHGQFLVVWESEEVYSKIYGRYVDAQTGAALGSRFAIDDSATFNYSPDVAYDPHNDRFVVVWQKGYITPDIKAKVLYGEYKEGASQFPEDVIVDVTASGETGATPKIALNAEDHVFMIVYDAESLGIIGRMAEILATMSGDLYVSDNFDVWTAATTEVAAPDIAWSNAQDLFFVVFEYEYIPTSSETHIAGVALYDTHQGSENQVIPDSANTVGRDNTNHYDCKAPSVVYDPLRNFFVTVFEHKQGEGEDTTGHIRAGFNSAVDLGTLDSFYPVETTVSNLILSHHSPQISYSGLGGIMHVVYITESKDIFDNDYLHVMERNLWISSVFEKFVTPRMAVAAGTPSQGLQSPALSGSHNGRSLVTWSEEYFVSPAFPGNADTTSDWDIMGQRIAPYWVQLPVMMKK